MDGIEQIEIMGTVPVETDIDRRDVEWVTYRSRAWLAPLWIVSYDGQWLRPVRLIAPKWMPGHTPISGVEPLRLLWKSVPVPAILLDSAEAPEGEWPLLDILEGPQIVSRNPAAGH